MTSNSSQRPIRALILTPTRELAAQVEESVRIYGKYTKLNSTVIFGGVGINPQIKQLKHGVVINDCRGFWLFVAQVVDVYRVTA